jgi:hypothetical protein
MGAVPVKAAEPLPRARPTIQHPDLTTVLAPGMQRTIHLTLLCSVNAENRSVVVLISTRRSCSICTLPSQRYTLVIGPTT